MLINLTEPFGLGLMGMACAIAGYKWEFWGMTRWFAAVIIGIAAGWTALIYAQAYDSTWVAQRLLLEKWTGAIEIGSAGLVGLIVGLIALFLCGLTKEDLQPTHEPPHQAQ